MSLLPEGPFGDRVRARLAAEPLAWLTTVGKDGTPQPNPVWFLWDGRESVLVYNRAEAARLPHIASRPNVSLNFNSNDQGGDIVVLTGIARPGDAQPPPHSNPDYVAKYGAAMERVSGSQEKFGADYPVPLVIEITRVRGY